MKVTKVLFGLTLIMIFQSCTDNHYHDGKYKGTIFDGGAWMNMHSEVLTIKGSDIVVEKYTIMGSAAGTTIIECKQFQDRIEVQDGSKKVLLLTENGNLRLNADVVYARIPADSVIVERKLKRVIKKKGDKLIFQ